MTVQFHHFDDPVPELSLGTPLDVLATGSHRPLLCELEDATGDATKWIVKSPSMYTHGATSLLREFIGSDLAALVGLLTPRVGLLRLPSTPAPTDESEAGVRAREIFAADAGQLAFCSEKVPAPPLDQLVLSRRGRRARDLVQDAIALFCFDAMFWHYDRTTRNPNTLLFANRLVAIDHDRVCHGIEWVDEAGLSADYSALVYQPGGDERSADLQEHILAKFLKRYVSHPAWAAFAAQVGAITSERVAALLARWPDELDRGRSGAIVDLKADLKRFLLGRIQNASRIVEEARCVVA